MDKKFVTLFKDLAQATANSAEAVMEYDKQKEDEKGFQTATIMRNDYQQLTEIITNAGDDYVPTKNEAAKLLVGCYVMISQLQDKITALQKALSGYQTTLIPNLQDIVEHAADDSAAKEMANEKFVIKEE